MRIAYLFNGHLRTFRDNASIVPTLIDRHPGDVFCQTFASATWLATSGTATKLAPEIR